MTDYGLLIQRQRKKKRLTQAQLAEQVGVTKGYISKIEAGRIDASMKTMQAIMDCLGLEILIVRKKDHIDIDSIAYEFFSSLSQEEKQTAAGLMEYWLKNKDREGR